jgi:dTDP-glucose pyrophosphorylase
MAGGGTRFKEAGYALPKPLMDVYGQPMIEVVINNLRPRAPHRFIFVCQQSHLRDFPLRGLLARAAPNCKILGIDGMTAGAACTVLLAREYIDNDSPLMIANCDQWVRYNVDDYLRAFAASRAAGFIMTMRSDESKWSYVRRDRAGKIVEVVEKEVVSNEATVGVYNFARGSDFVKAALDMIEDDERSKGEFYVAPTYCRLIAAGRNIESLCVGDDQSAMYGLGTPADLQHFLSLNLRHQIRREAQHLARCA